MSTTDVAFLGPAGTYSHLVAEKRFGKTARMFPMDSITDVFAFVARNPERRGIVPVENSSGGTINETVDLLLAARPRIPIVEELALDVRLALLGHRGDKPRRLYSHAVPIEHCRPWLKKHLPRVARHIVNSTALAAQLAAQEPGAVALCSRRLASLHSLAVLHYPVEAAVPNLTIFLMLGGRQIEQPGARKTTLAVKLPNQPGSLCSFLETFRDAQVNLSRLVSRPLRGCPREYAFLVDLEGGNREPRVREALAAARKLCVSLRLVGSYPIRKPYNS